MLTEIQCKKCTLPLNKLSKKSGDIMPKKLLNEEEITLEKLREQFQNHDFTETALKPYSEYTLNEIVNNT